MRMRLAAVTAAAVLLAAGAAYAATSLLDYANGASDPVGELSPRGDLGGTTGTGEDSHKQKRKGRHDDRAATTGPTGTASSPTATVEAPSATTTGDSGHDAGDDHGGSSGHSGSGGAGPDD
jgi:hypothetical protein